jgi:hypothetical protein
MWGQDDQVHLALIRRQDHNELPSTRLVVGHQEGNATLRCLGPPNNSSIIHQPCCEVTQHNRIKRPFPCPSSCEMPWGNAQCRQVRTTNNKRPRKPPSRSRLTLAADGWTQSDPSGNAVSRVKRRSSLKRKGAPLPSPHSQTVHASSPPLSPSSTPCRSCVQVSRAGGRHRGCAHMDSLSVKPSGGRG